MAEDLSKLYRAFLGRCSWYKITSGKNSRWISYLNIITTRDLYETITYLLINLTIEVNYLYLVLHIDNTAPFLNELYVFNVSRSSGKLYQI